MVLTRTNAEEEKVLTKPPEYYRRLLKEIVLTLNSRAEPYTDVKELERHFCQDTGYVPQIVAMEFGFPTFETFLKSDFMKDHVQMGFDSRTGKTTYRPHENPKLRHLRDNQHVSYEYIEGRKEKEERDKYARAMQPEFRGMILEGKRRLLQLAYELGAEHKDISYHDVQNAYLAKFEVLLDKEELRKFFARSNPGKILINYCNDEFVLSKDDAMTGMIFLKLKKSYKEILALHEQMKKVQEEYEQNKDRPGTSQPSHPLISFLIKRNMNLTKKFDRNRRKKVPLNERKLELTRIVPEMNPEIFNELNESSIFGKAKEEAQKNTAPNYFFMQNRANDEAKQPMQMEYSNQRPSTSRILNDLSNSNVFSALGSRRNEGVGNSPHAYSSNLEKSSVKLEELRRSMLDISSSSEEDSAEELAKTPAMQMRKSVTTRNNSSRKQSARSLNKDSDTEVEQADHQTRRTSTIALENSVVKPEIKVPSKPAPELYANGFTQPSISGAKNVGSSNEWKVSTKWTLEDHIGNNLPASSLNRFGYKRSLSSSSNRCVQRDETKPSVVKENCNDEIAKLRKGSLECKTDRVRALADVITTVIRYRAPEYLDLGHLEKTLTAMDPNYKTVLDQLSSLEFIEQNCVGVNFVPYMDLVLVGSRMQH